MIQNDANVVGDAPINEHTGPVDTGVNLAGVAS
jgi:hypothetical protein